MMFRCLLAALALATAATDSEAGPLRRRAQPAYQPVYQSPTYYQSYPSPTYVQPAATPVVVGESATNYTPAVTPSGVYTSNYTPVSTPVYDQASWSAGDGLDEVNAKRAAVGLRPFLRDEGLTQAARACAGFRAQYGLFGHTSNDFAFVPAGTAASSAGCAAYEASFGWMSCCVYDNYTYAGAAWVTGRDGRRYMHIFVR
jgi:hypothetical protein